MSSRKTTILLQDHTVITVNEFCDMLRIGRTNAYDLISGGEVETILLGGRRLIILQSVYDLIERRRQPTFQPGRHPTRWPRPSDAELPAEGAPTPPRRRGRPPKFRRGDQHSDQRSHHATGAPPIADTANPAAAASSDGINWQRLLD